MFWGTFFPALDGMEDIASPPTDWFRPYMPDVAAFMQEDPNATVESSVICTGKIKHTGKSTYVPQFDYLKTLLPKERWGEIKMTLAAPNWYHFRYKEGIAYPKDVYKSDDEYFKDISKAYQVELNLLYQAGCRNVQYDDPNLACEFGPLTSWRTLADF
jgi:methionine synthase II (cobalamin-independent)